MGSLCASAAPGGGEKSDVLEVRMGCNGVASCDEFEFESGVFWVS